MQLPWGGGIGGEGMSQFFSLSVKPGQSASCQRGLGLSLWGVGGRRAILMGAWSEPVQGRHHASQELNAENLCGLAKARSMVLGLWVPEKGNRVFIPGVLRRVKPRSAAWSK